MAKVNMILNIALYMAKRIRFLLIEYRAYFKLGVRSFC